MSSNNVINKVEIDKKILEIIKIIETEDEKGFISFSASKCKELAKLYKKNGEPAKEEEVLKGALKRYEEVLTEDNNEKASEVIEKNIKEIKERLQELL